MVSLMPTYSAVCPQCGYREDYIRKIDERNNTPSHCNYPMDRLLDTPMIQAQTVSGIIKCSDGTQHEGKAAFEKHMIKNDYIHSSDSESEAKYRKVQKEEKSATEFRSFLEKEITKIGD